LVINLEVAELWGVSVFQVERSAERIRRWFDSTSVWHESTPDGFAEYAGLKKFPDLHPQGLTPARLVSLIVWLDCACQGCPK
jgi:hypothetical protein